MWWWIAILIYGAGAVFFFRRAVFRAVSAYQKARVKIMQDFRPKPWRESDLRTERNLLAAGVLLQTFLWPLVQAVFLLALGMALMYRVGFRVLFPKGIVTDFDREQQQKKDDEKYREAKALLEQEGIEVEKS